MTGQRPARIIIPQSSQPVKASRAALGLLGATAILVVILTFSTLQNINRAQQLMESFLRDRGETIVNSIEASNRASLQMMMHHMTGLNPVHSLLTENSREKDIQFIIIYDQNGTILDKAGETAQVYFPEEELADLRQPGVEKTHLNRETGVFTYTKVLLSQNSLHQLFLQSKAMDDSSQQLASENKIISIGLRTDEFKKASRQDFRHTFFMGAILLLVGAAGIYAYYLYQRMRVTSANLTNMQLYTDSILESIPISLITLDANDRIVSCNQNTENLVQLSQDDLIGKNIFTVLGGSSEDIERCCAAMLEQQTNMTRDDGKIIPLNITCSPLLSNEDEKIGKVVVMRDMTSIRNMELQLERSRRMAALGKMAAGIAHEIRNPLGTLRGFAQYFGAQPQLGEDGKAYSELMISEIDRLNHNVSGLLQLSRTRAPEKQLVSLDELFAKTGSLLKADIDNHKIQFAVQTDSNLTLRLDPDLILQVLLNLVKNSFNATKDGGMISLTAEEYAHDIGIIVEDTGRGMSESEQERMFDPFYSATKTGTGLGLAISHQIVEQHQGRFEVKTEPGKGTKITVRLPKE